MSWKAGSDSWATQLLAYIQLQNTITPISSREIQKEKTNKTHEITHLKWTIHAVLLFNKYAVYLD